MEGYSVSVLISCSDGVETSFEESHEGSLKSLMIALKNMKDKTNEYLTGIVDEEKRNNTPGLEYVEKTNVEDNDVEIEDDYIEDDYIDSKIKKELVSEQSSSINMNKSDKRSRSSERKKKEQGIKNKS